MAGSKRLPRWLKVVLWTALSLVLIFYIAGGVVFSNMIRADALTPRGPTPDNGVFVVSVDTGTITLTSATERDDTVRPGVAGLSWPGGYGQIGEIIHTDGLEVTRRFTGFQGQPPPLCDAHIEDCQEVDIEGYAFQSDPSDVGLEFENVSFPSQLGDLGAWRIDSGDGSVWAIHAHGWQAPRREALRTLRVFAEAGVTSLVIDYRNDEGAPADPSGLYRFGRTEWEDMEAAVEYAVESGAGEIVLVGYSTGAALDLAFTEKSDLADHVVAMVFDAPNIDMAETVKNEASKRDIPGTSFPVPGSLTAVALVFSDLRWDVGWGEIDYADRAGDDVKVPTLVFHGLEDERVPITVSRRFRDGAPELVELVEVPTAGHVGSWNADPEFYETTLGDFLRANLP